jgi:hypothetical protein
VILPPANLPADTMTLTGLSPVSFYPPEGAREAVVNMGFRVGKKGTHSSRTLMLDELEAVLTSTPWMAEKDAYASAIIEGNCLAKPTASTRRISSQRLGELYALDPFVVLFRVLRHLWDADPTARAQLAMLASLARDPLFMVSAEPVLSQPVDAEIQRAPIREALKKFVGERMNESTLDKVVRNVLSSWTQTGHLTGRTFKRRQYVIAQPAAVAFALWLANGAGFRGDELLTSGWIAALDCSASSARGLAQEAKRIGLIDLRSAGDVVEFGLDRLDPGIRRQ